MNELPQNTRLKADEHMQPTAFLADGDAAATPPATKLDREISELHAQIKRIISSRTLLTDNLSSLVAFWAIATWFQHVSYVFPVLVLTGPTHDAMAILRVLHEVCSGSVLLAGFRRSDLKDLSHRGTLLIAEENLDARGAALLGVLANRNFAVVEQGSCLHCVHAIAVYVGEDPTIKRIQHSLYIDATVPALANGPIPDQLVPGAVDALRKRLLSYRTKHLESVRSLEFNPRGLSRETSAITNALGRCLVQAPQLQAELVALLRPRDQQQVADRSDGDDALVVNAALALSHQDRSEIFVKEIAAEVNRLLEARGETRKLTPEKVGHRLKKVGMYTRRLSQLGNGLTLDQPAKVRLHEIATAYRGEDLIQEDGNLHCLLCKKNESLREVM